MPASSGPSLELDWEVGAFQLLRRLWRAITPAAARPPEGSVALEAVVDRARMVASMMAGQPLRVLPARSEGGVRGRDVLMPARMAVGPDAEVNAGLYVLRAAIAGAMVRVGRRPPHPARGPTTTDTLAADLDHVERAVALATGELPALAETWSAACRLVLAARPAPASLRGLARAEEEARQALLSGERIPAIPPLERLGPDAPPLPLWGRWFGAQDASEAELLPEDARPPGDGTEIEAPAVEAVTRMTLNKKRQEEAVLQHTFEKVDVAENFTGVMRPDDGTDELAAHAEALKDLDLREVVRGGEAGSLYRAEIALDVEVPDVYGVDTSERGIPYPEWDNRAGRYRPGWCSVYPARVPASKPTLAAEAVTRHHRVIEALARRLEDHRTRMAMIDRQPEGDELDITAVVDNYASRAAGRAGTNRLYCRPERRRRDVATTVLLDVSLSADAWVGDRRVLDVAREAICVLGEVADRLGDRFEVLAFASNTRRCCRVWTVKGWDDPWQAARGRLFALEAQGYTRIGPALRHAAAGLARVGADRRLLLLVSDGKPTDQDRYEGRHGIADVRMALQEAERARITTHALTVETRARDYLPAMLGVGAWHILPSPDRLPAALGEVYGRLVG